MMDRWTDRLSEYLDGELTLEEQRGLEAHLPSCAECLRTLAELREVVARAAALTAAAPSTELWDGIQRRIVEGDPPAVLPFRTREPGSARARRSVSFSMPQLAAAALVIMFASGSGVWLALRVGGGSTDARSAAIAEARPDSSAAGRFTSNSPAYQSTIAQLERALADRRDQLDPVTIAVLESNLKIIDAAIGEATAALARDPSNPYLEEHLGSTIEKKIEVLRRAAAIGRAEI